jgi:putative pyruvate formate lyase activating enzyme
MMAQKNHVSVYLKTHRKGQLEDKIAKALMLLESCSVCPRNCKVNRLEGEKGFCRAGYLPKVSSSSPHFGEEQPLVGFHGSGTIFLTHCNLGCNFCQNYSISHLDEGKEISIEELSRMMVAMQSLGCHNINFVSPTHYAPQILAALPEAIGLGLSVPLVYNTGGYDSVEMLELLDGIFDIYMPDFKYSDGEVAEEYSQAADYPVVAKQAIAEMARQVGDLELDERGIALRGLLIRHLVLPSGLAGTQEVMRFLAQNISKNTYVNIMAQYYPCGDIPPGSPLYRRISKLEYLQAIEIAKKEGITRLD